MSQQIVHETLLALLEGDRALFQRMCEEALVPSEGALTGDDAETARIVHTLVHELEVNWPGVEVILRMRAELCATRRQVAELFELLRRSAGERP